MIRIMDDMQHCTGCGACASVCPETAIRMEPDTEGFLFPVIDEACCTECGLCRRTCPVNRADAGKQQEEEHKGQQGKAQLQDPPPATYACWASDDGLRQASSSGGAFGVLAQQVIVEGGIVFGAAFDGSKRVCHRSADTMGQLDDLRRSKYVQSDTGSAFRDVKSALASDRRVLFCGTPCQVAGLYASLGDRPAALLTCDFVCSGVPSPKVWRLHVEELERKYGTRALTVSFRDKSRGWRGYQLRIDFENGRQYKIPAKRDAFFIGFGKELFNRNACADCRFRTLQSHADLTLADFWDIWKSGRVNPAFRDNKGISLVVAHTPNGQQAVEETGTALHRVTRTYRDAASGNPRMSSSRPASPQRSAFFSALSSGQSYREIQRRFMDNSSPGYHLKRLIKGLLPIRVLSSVRHHRRATH